MLVLVSVAWGLVLEFEELAEVVVVEHEGLEQMFVVLVLVFGLIDQGLGQTMAEQCSLKQPIDSIRCCHETDTQGMVAERFVDMEIVAAVFGVVAWIAVVAFCEAFVSNQY